MFVVGSVWMFLCLSSSPMPCLGTGFESARRRTPVTITFHQHHAARRSSPNSKTTDPDKGRRDGGADALLIIRRRVVVHILPIWLDNKAQSGRRAQTLPLSFSDRKVIRKSEFVNRGGDTNMLFVLLARRQGEGDHTQAQIQNQNFM